MTHGFATYEVFLQAFLMGLLFLVAGYFVPASYDRKGFSRFLRDRAVRLGIPALIYMLVIQPLIVHGILRGYYQITTPFPEAYWHYLKSFDFVGQSGPMWFTVALLIFCLFYGLARLIGRGRPANTAAAPMFGQVHVIGLGLLMGLCTFLVRIVQPMGTNILNMQLCYFSQYILMFSVGLLAWRRNWLLRIPYAFGMKWFTLALTVGVGTWLAIAIPVLKAHAIAQISGGITWQSAAFSFWEAFFCLGVCLGFLVWFREKFNRHGRFTQWLSDNCFAVYMFHAPILISVTLALRGWSAPKPAKFLAATVLGVVLSYLASSLVLRRIPLLRRVL
jgi:surface polysaccharide O-acyltransferase-like enzyme